MISCPHFFLYVYRRVHCGADESASQARLHWSELPKYFIENQELKRGNVWEPMGDFALEGNKKVETGSIHILAGSRMSHRKSP